MLFLDKPGCQKQRSPRGVRRKTRVNQVTKINATLRPVYVLPGDAPGWLPLPSLTPVEWKATGKQIRWPRKHKRWMAHSERLRRWCPARTLCILENIINLNLSVYNCLSLSIIVYMSLSIYVPSHLPTHLPTVSIYRLSIIYLSSIYRLSIVYLSSIYLIYLSIHLLSLAIFVYLYLSCLALSLYLSRLSYLYHYYPSLF